MVVANMVDAFIYIHFIAAFSVLIGGSVFLYFKGKYFVEKTEYKTFNEIKLYNTIFNGMRYVWLQIQLCAVPLYMTLSLI